MLPKIHLCGIFGYGELGIDFLTEHEDLGDKNEDIKWIGYSTVFSIISFWFKFRVSFDY